MNTNVSDKLRKYKVSVFGESYFLVSDEPESHLINAAELVNNCMKDISKKSPDTDLKKIAVLVALQLASKTLKTKETVEYHQEYSQKLISLIDGELSQLNIEKI